MHMRDYCCGFTWKTGCRIYGILDIILGPIAFVIYGQAVEVFSHPDELPTAFKSSDPNANAITASPQELDVVRVIKDRIMFSCGEKVDFNISHIYVRLVLSVIFFTIGTSGSMATAVVFLVATFLKRKRKICIVVMCAEILFLLFTVIGGILFQTELLCPLNYSIERFPVQRLVLVCSLISFCYKLHEIYTIYRYMIFESLIEPEKTISLEALHSKRKSYAAMGLKPRKGIWTIESDSDSDNQMKTIVPPKKTFRVKKSHSLEDKDSQVKFMQGTRHQSITPQDLQRLKAIRTSKGAGAIDFRTMLKNVDEEKAGKRDTLMNVVDPLNNMMQDPSSNLYLNDPPPSQRISSFLPEDPTLNENRKRRHKRRSKSSKGDVGRKSFKIIEGKERSSKDEDKEMRKSLKLEVLTNDRERRKSSKLEKKARRKSSKESQRRSKEADKRKSLHPNSESDSSRLSSSDIRRKSKRYS